MEAILSVVLGRYLNTFIKGYSKDQLSAQIMKGTASLTNCALSEPVLQELLFLPTNLAVVSAHCNLLQLQIPSLTRLRKDPLELSIDELNIALQEPETIPPRPHILRDLRADHKPGRKAKENADLIKNMSFDIKKLRLSIQLRMDAPTMMLEVRDVAIRTTGADWTTTSLSEARVEAGGMETMFKVATVGSISLHVEHGKHRAVLLDGMPTTLRVSSLMRSDTGEGIRSNITVLLDHVHFAWTRPDYLLVVDMIQHLRACLERLVPVAQGDDTHTEVTDEEVIYNIEMRRWCLDLLEGDDGERLSFAGRGLALRSSPRRLVAPEDAATLKDPRFAPGTLASLLRLDIASFTFEELPHKADKRPELHHLIAHTAAVDATSSQASPASSASGNDTPFLSVYLHSHWATADAPRELVLDVAMDQLQFVMDRPVWVRFLRFFTLPDTMRGANKPQPEGPTKSDKLRQELKERFDREKYTLKQLYFDSDVKIKLAGINFYVPPDPSVECEAYETMALHFGINHITMQNRPGWTAVPHLSKGLQLFPVDKTQFADIVKRNTLKATHFQMELSGIHCDLLQVEAGAAFDSCRHQILEPSTITLFGRFLLGSSLPHLEVTLHSSELRLRVTQLWYDFLVYEGREHVKWLKTELLSLRPRDPNKPSFKAKVKKVAAAAEARAQGTAKDIIDGVRAKEYASSAEKAVDAFNAVVYVRLDRGLFHLPMNWTDARDAHGQPVLSAMGFELLEVCLENAQLHQNACVSLKTVQVSGLDHPKLPAIMSLAPLRSGAHVSPIYAQMHGTESSLRVVFLRSIAEDAAAGGVESELHVGLANMRIVSRAKAGQEQSVSIVQDLKSYAMEVVRNFTKAEVVQKRERGMAKARRAFDVLNMHWTFDLGECDFIQYDESCEHADDETLAKTLPKGRLRLANSNQSDVASSFDNLEGRLLDAKMAVATSEGEKMDLMEQLRALRKTVQEKDKLVSDLKGDLQTVQGALVEARLKLLDAEERGGRAAGGGGGGGGGGRRRGIGRK